MLRRRLFAILFCLLATAFALAGETAHAAMQGDPVCMERDATPSDGGDNGSVATACAMHCAVGACVISAISVAQLTVSALPPHAREAVLKAHCRSAPETAPPKAFAS